MSRCSVKIMGFLLDPFDQTSRHRPEGAREFFPLLSVPLVLTLRARASRALSVAISRLQLGNGLSCRSLVDYLVFDRLDLGIGGFIKLVDILRA